MFEKTFDETKLDRAVLAGLKKIVSAKHADLLDANLQAIQAGKDAQN